MKRNKVLDIIRAFGIILVVLGHCTSNLLLKRFIYIFHLPLFFLLSGYLYNEKSSKEPWSFVGNKMKKFAKLYILYGSFLVIFHNVFLAMGVFDSNQIGYNINTTIVGIFNSFLFQSNELFSAAMWFIPVLLVSMIIYNFITYYTMNCKNNKEIKRTILVFLITLLGLYFARRNNNVGLQYQTSLIVLPFIHLGQMIKLYFKDKLKPNVIASIIILIVTFICLNVFKGDVELSENLVWNPILFYGLASLLIYVVYVISYYIEKYSKKVTSILSYIGANTFQIMCLHIMCFKIVDFIIINLITKDYSILSKFTYSYKSLTIVYTLIGVFMPIIIVELIKKLRTIIDNKVLKKCN